MANGLHTKKRSPKSSTHKGKLLVVLSIVLLSCLWWIYNFSARYLITTESEFKTPWAVVLDGQGRNMYRTDFALTMLQNKLVDSVALSGTRVFKEKYASAYYVEEMNSHSKTALPLVELQHDAYSTLEEAYAIVPFFQEKGLDTVMLITSNFHSARAARIFNQVSKSKPLFVAIDIGNTDFSPVLWSGHRSMQKIWLVEWLKTVNSYFESDSIIMPKAVEKYYVKEEIILPEPVLETVLFVDTIPRDTLVLKDSLLAKDSVTVP